MRGWAWLPLLLAAAIGGADAPQEPRQDPPPSPPAAAVRFGVIGDSGTGKPPQYEVGRRMAASRATFPFDFVIMLGDNLYGRQGPGDYVEKFDRPYAELLRAGVLFYAALGNHDEPESRFYPAFNMDGQHYYTFSRQHVRFFVLDTNLLDQRQMAWLENGLSRAQEDWKICYFHHPLYSNAGRHGGDVQLRVALEPLLLKYGVDVVFSGHDHVYERIKPQKGITYFVAGSSGQLRRGDVRPNAATAASFDQDLAFMLVEVTGGELRFRAESRSGVVVDSGTIRKRSTT
jgi:predicted phosphodiesterase